MLSLEKIATNLTIDSIRQISVEQYHDMIATGILSDDDGVELLHGWLTNKMSKNPPHTVITGLLFELLLRILPTGWFVSLEGPITMSTSEPEPDIAIVQGKRTDYFEKHPAADQVALIIEVADSSLQRDRTIKKGIYAEAGIPAYWIINLVDSKIEVYAEPIQAEADYTLNQSFDFSQTVPISLLEQTIGEINLANELEIS